MAEISIFQDEAFSVDALLTVINDDHVLPGRLLRQACSKSKASPVPSYKSKRTA